MIASLYASMWVRLIFSNSLVRPLLAIEQLQHDDAGHVFLQICIDPGDGDANAPVALAHLAAEDRGRVEDERQHGEGDQRQPPVHFQHDDQDAQQHEDVFEDRHHAGGEHLVQRVHVAGDAGDETPDRVSVENAMCRRCRWRKIWLRRSNITFCPVHCMM